MNEGEQDVCYFYSLDHLGTFVFFYFLELTYYQCKLIRMADLKFLTALIVTFITGIQNVHSYDSEHNRVQNTSQNMTFDNDVLNSTQTQCEEIIGDIKRPMHSSGLCLSILVCLLAFVVYASIHKKVFRSTALQNQDNTKHWIHF